MPKTKILVVEDDPAMRHLCSEVLRRSGLESIEACNGVEGLQVYSQRQDEICLTLSDVTMPQMGGVEMARRMLEINSDTNIILMSGYGFQSLPPDEYSRLRGVLSKPFLAAQLVETVKKCLDQVAA